MDRGPDEDRKRGRKRRSPTADDAHEPNIGIASQKQFDNAIFIEILI